MELQISDTEKRKRKKDSDVVKLALLVGMEVLVAAVVGLWLLQ